MKRVLHVRISSQDETMLLAVPGESWADKFRFLLYGWFEQHIKEHPDALKDLPEKEDS